MMTLALAVIQSYSGYSSRYESSYNSGWIVGFIIGLLIALGIARLVSWGIRKLLEKTVVRDNKRRAAFIGFIISSVIAILFAILITAGRPDHEVVYTGYGYQERYEYFSTTTVSLIYVGMMFLWLMVDLKLADRDSAKELSIFDTTATNQAGSFPPPSPYQMRPNTDPGSVAPTMAFRPDVMAYQSPAAPFSPPPVAPQPPPVMPPPPVAPNLNQPIASPPPPTRPVSQQNNNVASVVDSIELLGRLRDLGLLSNEEFEEKKKELLNKI